MRRLIPNRPEVAAKVLEGEAILIHLGTGVYYSMDGSGAVVWELIEAGYGLGEIAEKLHELYFVPIAELQQHVDALAGSLLQEGLVREESAAASGEPRVEPDLLAGRYTPPELQIYRDMGDLLALDPPDPDLTLAAETPPT